MGYMFALCGLFMAAAVAIIIHDKIVDHRTNKSGKAR